MESAAELASRLTKASRKKLWNVYTAFDWPESLDDSRWFMAPELISLYGTDTWNELDEERRRKLSFHELVNFFSFVLQGERPLLEGVSHRLYTRPTFGDVTEYMHHFLDEENKHMVMFWTFCERYNQGQIYPEKKLALSREYAQGEEDIVFFIKVLVVEEIGDYYNVAMQRDDRLHPIVQQINEFHHTDEARHIIFGERYLQELWERHSESWSEQTLGEFRSWLAEYLPSSWRDFYNPSVYRDAGIEDPYAARQAALDAPECRAHRRRCSDKLTSYLLDTGMLLEEPAL